MTIAEALSIPKGMNFEEYEKLLKDKQKLEKQIAKASNIIQSEIDRNFYEKAKNEMLVFPKEE